MSVQKRQALKIRSCSNQINELNAQISDLRRRLDESNNSKKSLEQIATAVGRASTSTATVSSTMIPKDVKPIVLKLCRDGEDSNLEADSLDFKQFRASKRVADYDDDIKYIPSAKKPRE